MYNAIHVSTSKVKLWPRRFAKVQCRAFFLLIFFLTRCFELSNSAVSTLCAGNACHNMSVFQPVCVEVLLQIGVKITQFTTV